MIRICEGSQMERLLIVEEAAAEPVDGDAGSHARCRRSARADCRPRRTGQPVSQVRGVLAERVVISTTLDPFLSLRALSAYSGLSVRKLRDCLVDLAHPLPHYRVGGSAGKIVARRSEFDAWVVQYRQVGPADVKAIVHDVLRSLGDAKKS